MPPLILGSETNFHGIPITHSIVLLSSIATFAAFTIKIYSRGTGLLYRVVRVLGMPSLSKWAVGVALIYWSRPLEWRLGSYNYMKRLISSLLLATIACTTVAMLPGVVSLPGIINHLLLAVSITHSLLIVKKPHAFRICNIRISSHVIPILFFCAIFMDDYASAIVSGCGLLGSMMVHMLGALPLPQRAAQWTVEQLKRLSSDKPPKLLSGATLEVQRQQRTDLLEGFLLSIQQQQMRQAGAGANQPYTPSEAQVQQLVVMGFRREQAMAALEESQGNLTLAIQHLTLQM